MVFQWYPGQESLPPVRKRTERAHRLRRWPLAEGKDDGSIRVIRGPLLPITADPPAFPSTMPLS